MKFSLHIPHFYILHIYRIRTGKISNFGKVWQNSLDSFYFKFFTKSFLRNLKFFHLFPESCTAIKIFKEMILFFLKKNYRYFRNFPQLSFNFPLRILSISLINRASSLSKSMSGKRFNDFKKKNGGKT